MPADDGAIGKDTAVADSAVVGDVGVDHQEVAAADARAGGAERAAVNGDMLAKDVAVANLDAAGRRLVLQVLGPLADDTADAEVISSTGDDFAHQMRPCPHDASRPQAHGSLDHR